VVAAVSDGAAADGPAPARRRIAILISGRGSNMAAILRNAQEGDLGRVCEVALVFANDPAAPGLATAREHGIPTACLASRGRERREFDGEVVALLEPYRLDYLVLAGYMRLLSPVVIDRYRNHIVNIHPADSRAYQGIHGYRWAFERGLERTLVTVHLVDEGIDTGPILAQAEVDLRGAGSLSEVERRGLAVEHHFYSAVLADLFAGSI
jgi:phosphoribosylglycinamide formyltransferase-1